MAKKAKGKKKTLMQRAQEYAVRISGKLPGMNKHEAAEAGYLAGHGQGVRNACKDGKCKWAREAKQAQNTIDNFDDIERDLRQSIADLKAENFGLTETIRRRDAEERSANRQLAADMQATLDAEDAPATLATALLAEAEKTKAMNLDLWRRLIDAREALVEIGNKLNDAIGWQESHARTQAEKLGVDRFADSGLSVTIADAQSYTVKDWSSIGVELRHKRLLSSEVERAVKDPDHPLHARIHELLAEGDIETTSYKRVTTRRK